MTDLEFKKLETEIKSTMNRLDHLQKIYKQETGKEFVMPIQPSPSQADKEQIGFCMEHIVAELKDELKKFKGLPPYDGPENIVRGDGYFANYIYSTWPQELIEQVEKELKKEVGYINQ